MLLRRLGPLYFFKNFCESLLVWDVRVVTVSISQRLSVSLRQHTNILLLWRWSIREHESSVPYRTYFNTFSAQRLWSRVFKLLKLKTEWLLTSACFLYLFCWAAALQQFSFRFIGLVSRSILERSRRWAFLASNQKGALWKIMNSDELEELNFLKIFGTLPKILLFLKGLLNKRGHVTNIFDLILACVPKESLHN